MGRTALDARATPAGRMDVARPGACRAFACGLALLAVSCATRQVARLEPVPGDVDPPADAVLVDEEQSGVVCVQTWRDEGGTLVYPWRCLTVEALRQHLFGDDQ